MLCGFNKVELKAQETKVVRISVPFEDLTYYNETNKKWMIEAGALKLMIGSSSLDLRLNQIVNIPETFSSKMPIK